jgi:hypothetical protein
MSPISTAPARTGGTLTPGASTGGMTSCAQFSMCSDLVLSAYAAYIAGIMINVVGFAGASEPPLASVIL